MSHRKAARAHAAAGALIDERKFHDALAPASEACRLAPDWSEAWWNYAVALKHARRWPECLHACDQVIALCPDDADGMHWNAGIAATALGDWTRARAAWTAYGIELPDGDGPIEMKIGVTCVRVSEDHEPEVVWSRRLDPARARILSVPLPESDRRYGDVVLHDGEPRRRRAHPNGEVSVFDELTLLQRSPYGTWKITATDAERDELLAIYDDVDGAIEDWTDSVRILCVACSLGTSHEHHERAAETWSAERSFGLALRDAGELDRLRRPARPWRRGIRDVIRVS